MKIAPVPKDESRRLRALENLALLDTPQDERFDRITRVAADLFSVPIAAITLVAADRQWPKACVGIEAGESARTTSFCSHTILDEAAMVIPDTLLDERFADNPAVTGDPHVRFYAGQPIHAPTGEALGALCVVDTVPRTLSRAQLDRLRDLAGWVEEEIGREDKRALVDQLRDSQERIWTVMDSIAEGIVAFSDDGLIRQVNHTAERALGYGPGQMLGLPIGALLRDYETPRIVETVTPNGNGPEATKLGLRQRATAVRLDGSTFPMEVVITEARMSTGRFFVAIAQDVTDRMAAERVKDEFISVVGHELRTPLTAIRGSLGLVAGGVVGPLADEAQEMVGMAIANTDRLVRLVNDMLDIEKMDAGHLELDCTDVSTGALLQASLDAVQSLADEAGVTVKTSRVQLVVHADADRIVQTLVNLLGNAVKFSPRDGVVTVSVTKAGDTAEFAVRDNGRGIPSDQLDTIFERFRQIDATDAREKGGTGLGLAIAQRIVDWHGGRIWAESPGATGCTMRFTLPLATAVRTDLEDARQ